MIQYIKGAEPLLINGSEKGCLLLHGAGGGTAWDLKEFAQVLHSKTGMTVNLPALSGFGTKPDDLYNITFNDWWNDAQEGVKHLSLQCDKVYVVGHSVGGLLSLLLASEYPEILAIVTWAAPFSIRNRMLKFLPLIAKTPITRKLIPQRITSPAPKELIKQGWIGYDWIPPQVGFAVLEGLRRLKESLPNVKCPALMIQGTEDEMVGEKSADQIYDSINSSVKNKWYIEGATHPIMNNLEYKEILFEKTIEFLLSHE